MANSLGNKEVMASNIRRHLDRLGLNVKDFARLMNFKYSTVLDWVNAKTYPRIDKIELMANYFNVEKSDLVEKPSASDAPKIVSKDVLKLDRELYQDNHKSWVNYGNKLLERQTTVDEPILYYTYNYYDQPASAGTGQYLNDVRVETIELPVDYDADFVIPVYGDSMEPKYHSGDYVFVKLSVELSDADSDFRIIGEVVGSYREE